MTSPGDALAQLQAKDTRIAELEAELAVVKGPLLASAKYHKEERIALRLRAEKAEAEVERACVLMSQNDPEGQTPEEWHEYLKGGGRESGETVHSEGLGSGSEPRTETGRPTSAAANPAALTPGGSTSPSGVSPSPPRDCEHCGQPWFDHEIEIDRDRNTQRVIHPAARKEPTRQGGKDAKRGA